MGSLVVVGFVVLTLAAVLAFIACSAAVVLELWGIDDPPWLGSIRPQRHNRDHAEAS